jgi:hypothetical protein
MEEKEHPMSRSSLSRLRLIITASLTSLTLIALTVSEVLAGKKVP